MRREDIGEEARAIAVRALGQQYATPQDAALLRSVYAGLRSERARDAAFTAIAEVGGAENVRWLLDLARNDTEHEPAAPQGARAGRGRAGAPVGDLVKLYDAVSDYALKEALVSAFARSGERAALDKLIAIVDRRDERQRPPPRHLRARELGRPAREGSAEGHRDAVGAGKG